MKRNSFIVALGIALTCYACGSGSNKNENRNDSLTDTTAKEVIKNPVATDKFFESQLSDSAAYVIADTITYSVIVKNPDKKDEWTTECLKHLNLKVLVGSIFKAVYSGKITAYNYYTDKVMSIDEVKEMEAKHPRNTIGKVLFVENWYFDEKTFAMGKKINAIMLAYENRNENGEINTYAAGIKVFMNPEKK